MTVPGITVLFDDGSGTFPNDVSSRVSLANVSVGPFGRADESTTATTNSLSLLLRNDDGFFTGHGVGWDSGPWDSGMWGGSLPLVVGQKVRVIYTVASVAVDQFTGRISELGQVWGGGTGLQSSVAVSALDAMADLGRRQMRSMLEQEILLDSPTAYYTLGEADGSTSAGDTSGNGAAPLMITGSGTALAFGVDDGGSGTAVQFSSGGQYLTGSTFTETTPGVYSLAFRVTLPTFAGSYTILNVGKILVSMFSGVLQVSANGGDVGSGVLSANTPHDILITCDGSFVRLYVDGVLNNSGTIFPTSSPAALGTFVGFNDGFAGSIANLAIFDNVTLSVTDAANFYDFSAGSGTEATDARLTRLASYVGITASTSAPSGQLMEGQSTSGSTALDAFDAVVQAEGGFLFIAGDGTLTMQGRYYRSYKTTADWTVKGTDLTDASSVAVTVDTQQLINQVTVTRIGGATQIAVDQDSIDNSGVFSTSFDLAIPNDLDALGAAQWYVAKHATTGPRMASVPVNMMTSPNVANLFKMKIGDRVAFSSMPTQLWSDFADVTIEGWSDSLSVSGGSVSWTRTYNLLPWSLNEVALYDDAGSLYDVAVYGY